MSRPVRHLPALRRAALATAALALAALPVSAQERASDAEAAAGVEIAETVRIRAGVLTVDREAGHILMRNLDTGEVFVHKPPRQMTGALGVESGDVIEAVLTRGVTARLPEVGDVDRTETDLVSTPALSGSGPGFMGGKLTRSVVTLEAWNAVTDVAVVRSPEGRMTRYHVTTDAAREFLDSREPGDRIEVELSETVMVKLVEPAGD
ncbi:MAG: hypothetical protein ACQEUZ_03875 [Pseudomonadota bacterium]